MKIIDETHFFDTYYDNYVEFFKSKQSSGGQPARWAVAPVESSFCRR
jgi:hypothetical protein